MLGTSLLEERREDPEVAATVEVELSEEREGTQTGHLGGSAGRRLSSSIDLVVVRGDDDAAVNGSATARRGRGARRRLLEGVVRQPRGGGERPASSSVTMLSETNGENERL